MADARAGTDGHCQTGAAAAGGCEGDEGQRGQQGRLQYVVLDVSYFPGFKGAPGAVQLFREAVMAACPGHMVEVAEAAGAEEVRKGEQEGVAGTGGTEGARG